MLKGHRLAVMLLFLAGAAPAETKSLTVAGFAGSFETSVRAEIIPAFQHKFGVRVQYVAGNSAETLARLRSAKGPAIDVMIVDEAAVQHALSAGLCAAVEGLAADRLDPATRFPGDKAVALGIARTGIVYDAKLFAEKGWPVPGSWNDLKDARYRKLLVLPTADSVYGLEALVMLARANGGSENNIEPGFKALQEIRPNVLAHENLASKIVPLFKFGRAGIAVTGSGRGEYLAASGAPIGLSYPGEGAPLARIAACPTDRPAMAGLASQFVNALLEPGLQRLLLNDYGMVPANRSAVSPAVDHAPVPMTLDWRAINAHGAEWTARWQREIGR